jgi:hypothetical protein
MRKTTRKFINFIKELIGPNPVSTLGTSLELMIFSRTFLGFCLATFFLYEGRIQDTIWLISYAIFATIVVVQKGDVATGGFIGKIFNKKFLGFVVASWFTYFTNKMTGTVWLGSFAVFAVSAFAEGLVSKALGGFTVPIAQDTRFNDKPDVNAIQNEQDHLKKGG